MSFDAEIFEATYTAIGGYAGQKEAVKSSVVENLKTARTEAIKSFMSKQEELAASDGWLLVKSASVVSTAKTMQSKSVINPSVTGALMVGWHLNKKAYVSYYELSSGKYISDVKALRKHLDINDDKFTYCAEENIIARYPHVRFLAASAFRVCDNITYPIPACGYNGKPKTKCKLTLQTLGIKEIEWSTTD